jgi:hypothetical protein
MILEQEDLLQIKTIMVETIVEVVPSLIRPIIREEVQIEVRKEVKKEVRKQIKAELKIFKKEFKKELLEEIAIENKRQHQETRNYIFDRMEGEYTTKYEFGVQVERIDKLEKNSICSKG